MNKFILGGIGIVGLGLSAALVHNVTKFIKNKKATSEKIPEPAVVAESEPKPEPEPMVVAEEPTKEDTRANTEGLSGGEILHELVKYNETLNDQGVNAE
jgi:hypothetical protein